jgi:hypothetical protein
MNDEELNAIRKRAEVALGTTSAKSVFPTRAYDVIYEDVPTLLAEVERLQRRVSDLSDAESLLSEAHDLLGNIHGYDTDVYRAISEYFYGEDGD